MTTARQAYIDTFDAVEAQRERLNLGQPEGGTRWDSSAARFTADPRREPDANLRAIMEYVRPEHVVLDVGGGGGRLCLPMALRCREVVNVEPSRGMGEAFEASAKAAGIKNARWIEADWMAAVDVRGDVSLVANVTYFVRDVVPFIEKLVEASEERVMVAISVTPPPNQGTNVFELVNGEPQAPVPGYRELLPVLLEMGIVPDVRVLHEARSSALGGVYPDREAALESVRNPRLDEAQVARLKSLLEARFDTLFEAIPDGYRRRAAGDPRMLLNTWQT